MSRIALIGDNSVEYISKLIDIWNHGDCAVLLDRNIPPKAAIEIMKEAQVTKCIVEEKVFSKWIGNYDANIYYEVFKSVQNKDAILPGYIYKKFKNNYSKKEAVVIYSSGTTGRSKGIVLSHFAINTNADAILKYMKLSPLDCLYLAKSLTHSSTITGEVLVALKNKIKLVVAPLLVPPRYILDKIHKYGVSVICLNPLLLQMITEEYISQKDQYNISSLKTIYVSGSILNNKIYDQARRVFERKDIYNVYGLSEAGPRVTAQTKENCKSNSVGIPIEGVQVCIVDEFGRSVSIKEKGIIHIKTPSIYSGYVKGETKFASLCDNWFNTGDIGYYDEYGEIHIAGRIDDVIIIDSHKIYPNKVEDTIIENSNITDCVIVKIENKGREFLGCLYTGGNISENVQLDRLKDVLLPYEIPKRFVLCNELPKTVTGKISRKVAAETLQKML